MDFSMLLFIALLFSGLVIVLNKLKKMRGDSVLLEYSRAFFPIILIVFILRSFIIEPFRIPSGSMLPSLYIGDFILVNKFKYGIRLPILNTKIVNTGSPERGDVMVFRFPHKENVNYIKRVIGLPGDVIVYINKQLTINGKLVAVQNDGHFSYRQNTGRNITSSQMLEDIDSHNYLILNDNTRGSRSYSTTVPQGHYFVMGDNRDYSNDSRFWGFVPEENIVGNAFLIWFNWDFNNGGGVNWSRVGDLVI